MDKSRTDRLLKLYIYLLLCARILTLMFLASFYCMFILVKFFILLGA